LAVKLAKKNNVFNMQQRTFYIDDESDLDAIEVEYDCGIGDIAECPDGTIYRRHSDGYDGDLWEKKGSSGGGGGGSGNFVIHFDMATGMLDKTWQEIADAYSTGNTVVMINDINEEDYRIITSAYVTAMTSAEGVTLRLAYVEWQENQGAITYQLAGMEFVADSADDYPTMALTEPVQH